MPRKGKLTRAAVRRIFQSPNTAASLAPEYGVSDGLIHMIRQGRRYQEFTRDLVASKRTRGRRKSMTPSRQVNVDIDALADAILDRLVKRLRGR